MNQRGIGMWKVLGFIVAGAGSVACSFVELGVKKSGMPWLAALLVGLFLMLLAGLPFHALAEWLKSRSRPTSQAPKGATQTSR